jgi:hypothetical protein
MRKPVLILIIIATIIALISVCLGLLAFLSYQTTQYYWDGGYPLSEVQITVLDENNVPIPGAQVTIYDSVSGESTYDYPFIEYTSSSIPTTDNIGTLKLHQELMGIQFGGSGWDLFWIFPMGSQDAPMYTIEVSADGYQTLYLGIWDLLGTSSDNVETIQYKIYDESYEMYVYPHTYQLSPVN